MCSGCSLDTTKTNTLPALFVASLLRSLQTFTQVQNNRCNERIAYQNEYETDQDVIWMIFLIKPVFPVTYAQESDPPKEDMFQPS